MNSPFSKKSARARRGSVLVVAMIFAVLVGIALASFIRLGQSTLEMSNRAFYNNAAMNLCETGLEHGMWSLNRMVAGGADAWNGWTSDGTNATRTFTGTNFGQNTTGSVRVYVKNHLGVAAPEVYSRATIVPPTGPSIEKWVMVTTRRRSKFSNGIVAKQQVLFRGNNATVDSWNSDPDRDPSTAAVPWSNGVRNDNGSVASISVGVDSVLVKNSDIWGYAATGGAQPTVGPNGTILGADSAASGYTTVDPRRVSTDFVADLDVEPMPSGGTNITSVGATLGTAGTNTKWRTDSISLTGFNTLTIEGNVILILTASAGSNALRVTGSGQIIIPNGSSLTIYTDGDLAVGGLGILNSNIQPVTMQIYGTRTNPTQDISIAGTSGFNGCIYAPNADVTIVGTTEAKGSVVAQNVTFTGDAMFHYDESLADYGGNNPYGITRWRELTEATDRATHSPKLSF